jgi:branched-chain amino acid transport system permease protein
MATQVRPGDLLVGRLMRKAVDAPAIPAEKRGAAALLKAWLPAIVLLILLLVLPNFVPSYIQSLVTKMMIFALFGVSMNILWGYGGIPTFGHAAFFGFGGYVCGILIMHGGITNFWLNLLLVMVFTALLGAGLGVPAFRVYGVGASDNPIYFLLVTLAFGELLVRVAISARSLTGGSTGMSGIPYPDLGIPGVSINSASYYFLVLGVVVVCLLVIYRIVNSHYGYALRGIHDNERRMQALGFNTWLYKYTSYILAGMFGGVAGCLFAYFGGVMVPGNMGMAMTDIVFLIVILGSASVYFGPVIGAVVVVGVEYLASVYVPERWPLIMAVLIVVVIMVIPQGIGVLLLNLWRKVFHGSAA